MTFAVTFLRLVSCALATLFFSCATSSQVERLQQDATQTREQLAQLQTELRDLRGEHGKLMGRVYCNNEEIRDFVRRCESKSGLGCSTEAIAGALAFMDSQPYTALYLRPEGTVGMAQVRRGQLMEMIDPHLLHPTTRFLVLVQPRGEDPALYEEASTIGNQVFQYLRVTLGLSAKVPVLVHVLPCKIKAETMRHYVSRADRAQPGEPREGQPRLRIWVFRTDCGG